MCPKVKGEQKPDVTQVYDFTLTSEVRHVQSLPAMTSGV